MGKKKSKETRYTAFDYMSGGRVRKLGDRYGVDASDYNINYGRPSGGGKTYKGDRDDYDKAVADAAMRDYDTRRTMEAQAMSGKKKARKYAEEGFGNITDVVKANNMRERWHKKAGGGGSFSSASDFAGQTMRAVERDRRKQTAAYDETYAKTTDLNAMKEELMAQASDKAAAKSDPIEPSDRFAAVQDRLEAAASNKPPSLFDKDNAQPATTDDQADAARNFLDDYKLDVTKGANLKHDIETGLSNAARTVRDTYGR